MLGTILAIMIVVGAVVFVGRSVYRTMAGKKNCTACGETCPLSPDCDLIGCEERRVEHHERKAGHG